jgi:hypothetical protein
MNVEKSVLSLKKKRLFLIITLVFILLFILVISEIFLRFYMGLGNPVLYQSSPLYGYRPQPNQSVKRFYGSEIKINNLGLRALSDWDSNLDNKILFMGNSVTYGGSYIDNKDLFSTKAAEELPGYAAGNAGVNGWGIGNIKAFIIDYQFLPAKIYVSVLQEMDFYRGLSKLSGKPFWAHKPTFAWQEILYFFFYDRTQSIYNGHDRFINEKEKDITVMHSTIDLKELDNFLKSKGFIHLIYISPNKPQLLSERTIDPYVKKHLSDIEIKVCYLKDKQVIKELTKDQILTIFHDFSHLSKEGHELWGKLIGDDLKELNLFN